MRSHGRLGNQFFHYLVAQQAQQAGEMIVFLGFGSLNRLVRLSGKNRFRIPISPKLDAHVKPAERWLRRLGRSGTISRIHLDSDSRSLVRTEGKLPFTIVDSGTYQDWNAFSTAEIAELASEVKKYSIKGHMYSFAEIQPQAETAPFFFVHVRRGDYLRFPTRESPAVIPIEWYREMMHNIRTEHPGITFRVYSEDSAYVRRNLGLEPNTEVRNLGDLATFLEMAEASGGILSPSTFSLWSAYFAHIGGAAGPFLAPNYWLGWRDEVWIQPELKLDFLSYQNVFPTISRKNE